MSQFHPLFETKSKYNAKEAVPGSTSNAVTAIRRVTVPENWRGGRLDQILARLFPEYSRSRLQQWLQNGYVQVDSGLYRPKDRVRGGECIALYPAEGPKEGRWQAQEIPLEICYEDEALLVLNKPAGLVVHPAAGNPDGTLVNALLHHAPELSRLPRAGIVHRLDKDTSGLLVIARTLSAHKQLVEQLQARSVAREYQTVVTGVMAAGGTVDAPIARHPVDRKRMAVVSHGKPAMTHYRVDERFRAHTYLRIKLETGRTHQIRVHMAYLRYPIVGDPVYGGRPRFPRGVSEILYQALQSFPRQALHAGRLGLRHPSTGRWLDWEAPLPSDFLRLLKTLREDVKTATDER